MSGTLLQTKLFAPPLRPSRTPRPRLQEKLDQGLHLGGKLTLISAPAGFGKTTLVTEWLAGGERPVAWLSLDEEDNDPARFLAYVVAALQRIAPEWGETAALLLASPQPPPPQAILTALLNEIAAAAEPFVLVLDDYHQVDAPSIDETVTFLLDHQPPQMHLVLTTREDPHLPLARLRARRQLTELRAADLRFSQSEAADFLRGVMGLDLTETAVAALETRTEGWIAGLQLAALSLQADPADAAGFIANFSGSHRFVLDYLVEEVLRRQPEKVHRFLLHTAILDRLSGPLCDAIMGAAAGSGQEMLEQLERANLFLLPLDNERRWYRYHHLFADLLRQRLPLSVPPEEREMLVSALHGRAAGWFEEQDLLLEAFQHAAAANDIPHAARLIAGNGMPLPFRGAMAPVSKWLASLPPDVLAADPALLVTQAMTATMAGRATAAIPAQLQNAEALLPDEPVDYPVRDLQGQIAAIRAMLAVPGNQAAVILAQSQRALANLHPDNAPVRMLATWSLGYAYQVQGNREAAREAFREAGAAARRSGNVMVTLAALTNLGQVQESELQLRQAAETYTELVQMADALPWMMAYLPVVLVGLGRIYYQWNALTDVEDVCRRAQDLAGELENVDTPAAAGILLARLRLAQGDGAAAQALLAETEQFIRTHQFDHWLEELTEVRIQAALQAGDRVTAAQLAQERPSPLNRARVALEAGDPAAALAALAPALQEAEAQGWADKRLALLVVAARARAAQGERAPQALQEALVLAAPGGVVRLFVDEGPEMSRLLAGDVGRGIAPEYVRNLRAAFGFSEGAPGLSAAGRIWRTR
jgi:LuxR family maltose regulon positive regulatory protein